MGKRKQKRGKAAKNARKGICDTEPEELVKAPHSFVINRGRLGKNGHELLLNFRKIMEPFTASHLKVQKANVLKDFVHIAGPLNVTHLVVFTKTENSIYLRTAKLPHGPTLTYQIKEYSLVKDIISSQKKSVIYEKLFDHHPLLVLNNFSGNGMHLKLMATTFQHMFPSINVNKTNLNTIRRCLLLNYNEDKTLDLRQYAIKVVPTGMSKAVKKLIQSKVPNLSQYKDIADFIEKSGNLSESEVEFDGAANTVTLPQPISSRGNIASEKSAIRLYEIGPRMTLQLMKIEEGLMSGEVLYHQFVSKTPEEIKALKERLKEKKLLKEKRKAEQQRNVEKKKLASQKEPDDGAKGASDDEREEDLKCYREAVGEEPDDSVLPILKKRKFSNDSSKEKSFKKVKFSNNSSKEKSYKKVKFSNDSSKEKSFKKVKFSNAVDKKQPKESKSDKEYQDFLKRKKKKKEAKLKHKGKKGHKGKSTIRKTQSKQIQEKTSSKSKPFIKKRKKV